jgi:hypothetical protein
MFGSRGRRAVVVLTGLAAAGTGAALGAAPPTVTVAVDTDTYRVGDVILRGEGSGVYSGPAGAIVIAPDGERASASTHLHGTKMLGSCVMAPDRRSERCSFDMGGLSLTATDRLDREGWDRRYQDGQAIRITLEGGRPVPVPIALGR